jgi:uncharacterized repeat protein (TIGR03803 family)
MSIRNKLAGALVLALGFITGSAALSPGHATLTQTVLYTFCPAAACGTGSAPQAPLLQVGTVLYGTTTTGGHNGGGTAFQYDLSTSTLKVIYQFCSVTVMGHSCLDGYFPNTRLIADTSGNLYGTTQYGGAANGGLVFKLTKPTGSGSWGHTELYEFCSTQLAGGLCVDGKNPATGLTYLGQAAGAAYDGSSLLYGATLAGGGPTSSSQGDGTIYALESGTIWSQKVIHTFCSACSATCTTCSDGVSVFGQMVMDANNTLWGTTLTGGSGANGVAWQLTPGTDPWGDPWSETLLYNFCWGGASKCLDGSAPTGAMLDGSGNIFGTTQQGGNGVAAAGNGILFELAAGSSCTEGGVATFLCETVEHNFCHTTCSDGSVPNGDLVMSTTGKIFGTAQQGGANGGGVAFRQNGATNVTIYTFCSVTGCTDGDAPGAGLILDSSGDLFGTTAQGGNSNNGGVLFELQ